MPRIQPIVDGGTPPRIELTHPPRPTAPDTAFGVMSDTRVNGVAEKLCRAAIARPNNRTVPLIVCQIFLDPARGLITHPFVADAAGGGELMLTVRSVRFRRSGDHPDFAGRRRLGCP